MTDISKASAEAVEAARQGDRYAELLTAIQAAQIVQQLQQPTPAPVVQPPAGGGAAKWIGLGIGGSVFLLTMALAAVAVAIAAASLALVALVIWAIWRDVRRR